LVLRIVGSAARDFSGNISGYGMPVMGEYLYGPDIFIWGVVANGHQVDFSRRAANYLNLTIASEAGSCPYLLADVHGVWETYGKILHRANTQTRETSQTVAYPEYLNRFRLEERERELARISRASVEYLLSNGSTVQKVLPDPRLETDGRQYLELYWGESFVLEFEELRGFESDEVIETRLTLKGYYVRDTDIVRDNSE
jgi:hypothetical protein